MPSQPRVSIIVPCYNHERFVRETITSAWAQTYPHIQLIVIDDASTDGSAAVVADLRREREFVYLRNEQNLGLNASIERGLEHAEGEFTALVASDDVLLPEKIALQVEWLSEHGADGVYATGYVLLPDGRREPIVLDEMARSFAEGTALRQIQTRDTGGPLLQSGLFRTSILKELAPVRRQFKSDDWALAIRMLERYRIGFMNQPVFLYRQHPENTFRNYWRTFPMRVEVLSQLTPEPLRLLGLANLLESQAAFLAADGKRQEARRFLLASIALDASFPRAMRLMRNAIRERLGRLKRRLLSGTPQSG